MNRMQVLLLLLLSFTFGCGSLPEGEAPKGEIVSVQMYRKPLAPLAARNRICTGLTFVTLNELPGAKIRIDAPEEKREMLEKILHSLTSVSGVKAAGSDSPFMLKFRSEKGTWQVSLIRCEDEKVIWSDHFPVLGK